jgi:hypothetical protein
VTDNLPAPIKDTPTASERRKAPPRVRKPSPIHDQYLAPTRTGPGSRPASTGHQLTVEVRHLHIHSGAQGVVGFLSAGKRERELYDMAGLARLGGGRTGIAGLSAKRRVSSVPSDFSTWKRSESRRLGIRRPRRSASVRSSSASAAAFTSDPAM